MRRTRFTALPISLTTKIAQSLQLHHAMSTTPRSRALTCARGAEILATAPGSASYLESSVFRQQAMLGTGYYPASKRESASARNVSDLTQVALRTPSRGVTAVFALNLERAETRSVNKT